MSLDWQNKVVTVALVIHGVGDHRPLDIIGEAQKGLKSAVGDSWKQELFELPQFPQLDGTLGEQSLIALRMGDLEHAFIPLVWSELHARAVGRFQKQMGTLDWSRLISPQVYRLAVDSFRCIGKSRPGSWRKAVASVAFIYSGILFGIVPALALLYIRVLEYLAENVPLALAGASLMLCTYIIGSFLGRCLPVIDFPGDVAFYVGSDNKRTELENNLVKILHKVDALAPKAKILLVGHSLGSILVVRTYLRLVQNEQLRKRIVLVTLGSPLRFLSRLFPGVVPTPETVANSRPYLWVNFWRDGDRIGRPLMPRDGDTFAERSLGKGGHANMWRDTRLWRALYEVLSMPKPSGIKELWGGTKASRE